MGMLHTKQTINLVELPTTYQLATAEITYHNFEKAIQRVAHLPPTNERYTNLFSFENCGDLVGRLGTSKYLMSLLQSGYDRLRNYWRRRVSF